MVAKVANKKAETVELGTYKLQNGSERQLSIVHVGNIHQGAKMHKAYLHTHCLESALPAVGFPRSWAWGYTNPIRLWCR